MNHRICIFSYNCTSEYPDSYIVYLLEALKKNVGYLLIAVNNGCPAEAADKLRALADEVIVSEKNTLSGAYEAGIEHIAKNHFIDKFDELVLADDSFFGPLYSFEALFEQGEKALGDADFWGISCTAASPQEMIGCKYNLQPYFMVIRKKMLASDEFARFWQDRKKNSKDLQLHDLSQLFTEWGFKQGVLYNYEAADTLSLLKNGFPVLLRSETECSYDDVISEKLHSDVPQILKFIKTETDYDTELIMDKAIKAAAPLELLSILNNIFILPEDAVGPGEAPASSAVLLLELSGEGCADAVLNSITGLSEEMGLVIITDNGEQMSAAQALCPKGTVICRESSADFGQTLLDAVSGYKYIGFMDFSVSCKTAPYTEEYIRTLTDNIVGRGEYLSNILRTFENDPRLGLLMPVPAVYGKFFGEQGRNGENDYQKLMDAVQNGEALTKVSECGYITCFWCRAEAVMPVAEYFIKTTGRFMAEGASAILPYEAKNNGYSCGYISSLKQAAVSLNDYIYSGGRALGCLNEFVCVRNTDLNGTVKKLTAKFADVKKYSDVGYMEKYLQSMHSNAKLIKRSKFFNSKWYAAKYPESLNYKLPPEYHYLNVGWKIGYDPSDRFSTETYLQLNDDVRKSGMCPLVHFERFGRNERRPYNTENGSIIRAKGSKLHLSSISAKLKNVLRNIKYFIKYRHINENKIVFRTFQNDYTCNPKYICEELLRQELPFEIVWIAENSGKKNGNFPRGVRLVKSGTGEALKEIMTAKILIDNGILPLRNRFLKKKEQISINTWHGSLGFKRLDGNQLKKSKKAAKLYGQINDFVISDSTFEDDVFRSSNWKKNEFIKCGHPRNDILISCDPQRAALIRDKVFTTYNIPENKRLVLYAPTFREKLVEGSAAAENEDIDLDMLCDALQAKFGGEWCVLMRAHFVNSKMNSDVSAKRHSIYNATAYPDIQELMIAADVGVTDYSSWILDFMFSRKPAFLYTPDYDNYDLQRGFYYPLSESPFPAGKNNAELSKVIGEFDSKNYNEKIDVFLKDKGCREDGCGSRTMAEFIKKLMNYKEKD